MKRKSITTSFQGIIKWGESGDISNRAAAKGLFAVMDSTYGDFARFWCQVRAFGSVA